MEQLKYHSWDYFPLNLYSEEISNPLLVLDLFFNISSLPGHLRLLKKWRKYIINNGYYKGQNGDPSDLIMVHKDTVRLIEAAFLLDGLDGDRKELVLEEDDFHQQVALEREAWDHYPRLLSKKQTIDPMRVIKTVCRSYQLPEYREHLHSWLNYRLSVAECDEFLIPSDLIKIYDILQKLFEACWLIHMRRTQPVILSPISDASVADSN